MEFAAARRYFCCCGLSKASPDSQSAYDPLHPSPSAATVAGCTARTAARHIGPHWSPRRVKHPAGTGANWMVAHAPRPSAWSQRSSKHCCPSNGHAAAGSALLMLLSCPFCSTMRSGKARVVLPVLIVLTDGSVTLSCLKTADHRRSPAFAVLCDRCGPLSLRAAFCDRFFCFFLQFRSELRLSWAILASSAPGPSMFTPDVSPHSSCSATCSADAPVRRALASSALAAATISASSPCDFKKSPIATGIYKQLGHFCAEFHSFGPFGRRTDASFCRFWSEDASFFTEALGKRNRELHTQQRNPTNPTNPTNFVSRGSHHSWIHSGDTGVPPRALHSAPPPDPHPGRGVRQPMPASSSEDLEKRLAALKKSRKGREKRALGSTNRSNEPAMAPAAAAARAPPQQESAADLLFDALDVNHDGVISKEEMVTGLTQQSARMVAPPAPAPAPAVYRPPPAPAPAAYRAPPGDDDSSATRQENHSLREEVDELRRENGHARAQIQDLNGQLDAEKRASRQKVQELEMLLKHVTEELGRQEGGGASSEELMQAHDDIANLEQELHSIERRQAAELRRVRASVSANAGTGEEVELLKKERAARDIVINQLNEELEEAKNGQVARPSAMDALAGKSAGDPEALEYALRELDTAKNEIRNRDRRVEELEREHRNMSFKNEELLHGAPCALIPWSPRHAFWKNRERWQLTIACMVCRPQAHGVGPRGQYGEHEGRARQSGEGLAERTRARLQRFGGDGGEVQGESRRFCLCLSHVCRLCYLAICLVHGCLWLSFSSCRSASARWVPGLYSVGLEWIVVAAFSLGLRVFVRTELGSDTDQLQRTAGADFFGSRFRIPHATPRPSRPSRLLVLLCGVLLRVCRSLTSPACPSCRKRMTQRSS